jgi:Mg-chelatase subunit ChlD
MKPTDETPNPLRQQLEERIIALLLHEHEPEEAAEVERLVANDPVLAAFHARMKHTLGLVKEVANDPQNALEPETDLSGAPKRLDEEHRRELLQHFQNHAQPETDSPQETSQTDDDTARPLWWRRLSFSRPMLLAACLIFFLGLVFLIVPQFVKSRTSEMAYSRISSTEGVGRDELYSLEMTAPVPPATPLGSMENSEKTVTDQRGLMVDPDDARAYYKQRLSDSRDAGQSHANGYDISLGEVLERTPPPGQGEEQVEKSSGIYLPKQVESKQVESKLIELYYTEIAEPGSKRGNAVAGSSGRKKPGNLTWGGASVVPDSTALGLGSATKSEDDRVSGNQRGGGVGGGSGSSGQAMPWAFQSAPSSAAMSEPESSVSLAEGVPDNMSVPEAASSRQFFSNVDKLAESPNPRTETMVPDFFEVTQDPELSAVLEQEIALAPLGNHSASLFRDMEQVPDSSESEALQLDDQAIAESDFSIPPASGPASVLSAVDRGRTFSGFEVTRKEPASVNGEAGGLAGDGIARIAVLPPVTLSFSASQVSADSGVNATRGSVRATDQFGSSIEQQSEPVGRFYRVDSEPANQSFLLGRSATTAQAAGERDNLWFDASASPEFELPQETRERVPGGLARFSSSLVEGESRSEAPSDQPAPFQIANDTTAQPQGISAGAAVQIYDPFTIQSSKRDVIELRREPTMELSKQLGQVPTAPPPPAPEKPLSRRMLAVTKDAETDENSLAELYDTDTDGSGDESQDLAKAENAPLSLAFIPPARTLDESISSPEMKMKTRGLPAPGQPNPVVKSEERFTQSAGRSLGGAGLAVADGALTIAGKDLSPRDSKTEESLIQLRSVNESLDSVTKKLQTPVQLSDLSATAAKESAGIESGYATVQKDGAVVDKEVMKGMKVGGSLAISAPSQQPVPRKPASKTVSRQTAVKEEARKLAVGALAKAKSAPAVAPEEPPVTSAPRPALKPLPEVLTAANRFSTFSLNVSDVSFKLAAASLSRSTMPDKGTVRSEEFINAMNYHDPAPAIGSKLSLAWERAQNPFAHNRDLVRLSIQTAAWGRESGRPLNLVLLLDNSGSMERSDRVEIIRQALRVLARQLKPSDRVSVVAFARTARLWVDGMPGGRPDDLVQAVGQLNPQGGTNLELALKLAYSTAEKHFQTGANNRVILLTDGAANLGDVDPVSLKQRVEDARRRDIALDCFGVGWEGYNDNLLEELSRNGDGRYGFLNNPQEAAQDFAGQLAGALQVAAANVKAQIEFNPDRVTTYRQIGYQKHQLTKEQFRDNKVDAAEIGAAESGTALYSVQVNPQGQGPIGVVRVRFKSPSTGLYEEREWPLPYQPTVPALDAAYPSMRLAAVAASFAEWLAESPFAAEVTLPALQGYLNGVPQAFPRDPRPSELLTMIKQARNITGQ